MVPAQPSAARFPRVRAAAFHPTRVAPQDGFVGPDGAGKTTIMRLLAAVMTPDEGSIAIEGLTP
ncbi:MAG: ATP-binding cassette domain-containing protein [Roseiarcus sp.]